MPARLRGPGSANAGDTIESGLELTDAYGRPRTVQPSGGVTVQVLDDGEDTIVLAEGAATLKDLDGGTASGGSASTLQDATRSWRVNQWAGFLVRITAGVGVGQERRIRSNTATTLTIDAQDVPAGASVPAGPWSPVPDATSVYRIHDATYLRTWAVPSDQAGNTVTVIARSKDATAGNRAYRGKLSLAPDAT